ncbi:MAG: arsenic efflux protein [Bacillus sp. (in: Bacteria)]|nr:arsenic efflux protein [Bacillus sp. (in: firmicutes)]MCM1426659.1 arsenic efflux protein [Eubacterium sp.]
MFDTILDALLDCVKLLPFLFLTYLAMEYLEHKAGDKLQNAIRTSGKCGPIIGSILGAFPQCGFSAAASNLYAGRIITLGTLISIYLSTSDEMLPILISENVGIGMILKILGIKILIGMAAGIFIDVVISKLLRKTREDMQIEHMCEQHNCHCEEGIIKSAFHHTFEIFFYVLLITVILNIIIALIGEDFLANLILNRPVIGELIAGAIGLIPNCASSVVITQLYLNGVLSAGAMMSGLLAGAGVGVLVLLRVNDNPKENIKIILLLYALGVAAGIFIELLRVRF